MKNQPFARRLSFALAGLAGALRTENSFRFHVLATVGVLAVLLWLRPAPLWWAVVAVTIVVVLAAELINTALEHLADHLHPEQHPRIKMVKDCAAAAVLIATIGALAVAAAFLYEQLR
jgi:undecaprenol kinase